MAHFKTSIDYHFFADEVKTERRFFQGNEAKAFLDTLASHSKRRECVLPAGTPFFRARTGSKGGSRTDHERVDRKPLPRKKVMPRPRLNAQERRMNPRGITYLYVASNPETAISEVRPSVGAFVTVAQVKASKDLTVVCFRKGSPLDETGALLNVYRSSLPGADEEAIQRRIDQDVWDAIDTAFSEPVGPDDEHLNYVPTQIVAERLLSEGYDGVTYKSSQNTDGYNLALFDLCSAKFVSSQLFHVDSVEYRVETWPKR